MMTGSASVNNPALYYHAGTAAFLALLAVYDLRHHKVKNLVLLCFVPWCLLSLPLYAEITGLPYELFLIRAILGFLSGGLVLLFAALATDGGIGGGDIKLTALLGFICGTRGICLLLIASSAAALLFLLIKKRFTGKREGKLPFVPFLFAGLLLLPL